MSMALTYSIYPSINGFCYWKFWICWYSIIWTVKGVPSCIHMIRANWCPISVFLVCTHFQQQICYIHMILLYDTPLLWWAFNQWRVHYTIYSQDVRDWPVIVQRLNMKSRNFYILIDVLSKHAVFFWIFKFLDTFWNWRVYLNIW